MRLHTRGILVSLALAFVYLVPVNAPAQRAGVTAGPRSARRTKAPKASTSRPIMVDGVQVKSSIDPVGPIMRALAYSPQAPTFPVVVESSLNLDAATQGQYQQLANQLSGFGGVPDDRLAFYSAFVNSTDYTILGWQGVLENVKADPSGSIVTVAVIPTLDIALSYEVSYSEDLLVRNDGSIQYLNSSYPAALAGQFPVEFEEY